MHLRAAGARNIEDISRNIAGLSVQNLGPGQSQVAIRGISAGKIDRDLAGIKEQVGVYMDESVISLSLFTPDLDLYDLNRVEVLRGPAGHPVRFRFPVRHGSLHQQSARRWRRLRQRRGGLQFCRRRRRRGRRPRNDQHGIRRPRGHATRRLLLGAAGLYRRAPAGWRRGRRRQQRNARRRAAGLPLRANRKHCDYAARHLPRLQVRRL